ncbi:MAG TPA: ABC transporter permease, partial [Candidatus Sulfotelmatobacter sp.]|nr:ABC transporter permease [Candidatus Sulfotelmatobacter sp.]
MGDLALAFRLARRELRAGLGGFRIFIACLALGVAAIAGVGSLAAAVDAGLRSDGRALLGGDIELRLVHRQTSPEEQAWLVAHGTVSSVAQMRAIAHNPANQRRTLVELKAVDAAYPLYGQVTLAPPAPLASALAERDGRFGAVVEAALLDRLGVKIGEPLTVGDATVEVRGAIDSEPDRGSGGLALGPRLMISTAALPATGLVQPGSLITWAYRMRLPAGSDPARWTRAADDAFPDAGWQVRNYTGASPGLKEWVDRIGLFLTLVGLTALLVGGVGVGNAVKSYLEGRSAAIATLKCLGASGRTIFQTYLLQVMAMALAGVIVGLALGAAVPALLVLVPSGRLPVPPHLAVYPAPLLLAAAYGLLTALAFAVWPLARARLVPAAGLFRDLVAPTRTLPGGAYVAATVAAYLALAAVAVASAGERRFALGFVAGAIGSFLLLRAAAAAVVWLARRAGRPRLPLLRMALSNLHRPGAGTASVMLSLGLGVTLLVTVALIQGNLALLVRESLPDVAPAFFFIDIQPDQIAAFERLATATPGVSAVAAVPSLRGRIVKVNGVPAEQVHVGSNSRWALRGDRGLTYASQVPAGSTVVAGRWWPPDYHGPPLISLDAGIAADMGLKPGDRLTVNVLGRDIEATIANLRRIDWGTLGINFAIVFAPGTLEAAPHTFIATAHAEGAAEAALYRAVTDRFHSVSVVRVKDAIAQVNAIMNELGFGVRAASLVTILAGLLVLAGAIAAGQRARLYDATVLKVLGATRTQIA